MLADDAHNLLVSFRNVFGLNEPIQFGETGIGVGMK
jgi:hypothetical protein